MANLIINKKLINLVVDYYFEDNFTNKERKTLTKIIVEYFETVGKNETITDIEAFLLKEIDIFTSFPKDCDLYFLEQKYYTISKDGFVVVFPKEKSYTPAQENSLIDCVVEGLRIYDLQKMLARRFKIALLTTYLGDENNMEKYKEICNRIHCKDCPLNFLAEDFKCLEELENIKAKEFNKNEIVEVDCFSIDKISSRRITVIHLNGFHFLVYNHSEDEYFTFSTSNKIKSDVIKQVLTKVFGFSPRFYSYETKDSFTFKTGGREIKNKEIIIVTNLKNEDSNFPDITITPLEENSYLVICDEKFYSIKSKFKTRVEVIEDIFEKLFKEDSSSIHFDYDVKESLKPMNNNKLYQAALNICRENTCEKCALYPYAKLSSFDVTLCRDKLKEFYETISANGFYQNEAIFVTYTINSYRNKFVYIIYLGSNYYFVDVDEKNYLLNITLEKKDDIIKFVFNEIFPDYSLLEYTYSQSNDLIRKDTFNE